MEEALSLRAERSNDNEKIMSFMKGLKCRECGKTYPKEAIYVCEYCFGSLEVDYDYDAIKKNISREQIEDGPQSIWRYRALLPIDGEPTAGLYTGFTPLVKAATLAKTLGVKELYIKDDTVCHPTFSFKDRVVSVALSRAKELGFDTVACASTGNLANSVAAHAAKNGFQRYIFIPHDLEYAKILASLVYNPNLIAVKGNYDDVNRLCSEIAGKYRWAFVNVNIRPYYAEGSKTFGYEVAEQLGWQTPQHLVCPAASGSLLTKIWKAFKEFYQLGLIKEVKSKLYCAQAEGCSPIAEAIQNKSDAIRPVKPKTIAKSLAIGNPADGYYAKDAVFESGGTAAKAADDEIREAIKLLARTEGIFTETAGGVTLACTIKLIESGVIPKDESVVVAITGNGLKTQGAIRDSVGEPVMIEPSIKSFESILKEKESKMTPAK
ncbi:MAG: threonine synthase [Candidatus Omnitrophica bacterium CG11_big_fil_rev_8_21_14_0_20_45_26]|uniref:Threonine synthase n=1 Tax=Candidatus Abzuiibacterium crystallinum TaxID=1974748 RepID=A0A2H0LQ05_9BACT|nr:MAG: threonine synthase [Candidatus Omnitrophica bacterium CG11_big_fil_rev_8_21_14_0_20_45_26]PIW64230.1 MAG: threonine synthase [Candidatus Omnitrophica bacterium CG12_big_fil_rev_8_21_14_0_65_45_16]